MKKILVATALAGWMTALAPHCANAYVLTAYLTGTITSGGSTDSLNYFGGGSLTGDTVGISITIDASNSVVTDPGQGWYITPSNASALVLSMTIAGATYTVDAATSGATGFNTSQTKDTTIASGVDQLAFHIVATNPASNPFDNEADFLAVLSETIGKPNPGYGQSVIGYNDTLGNFYSDPWTVTGVYASQAASLPEPATLGLFTSAAFGLMAARRRRSRAA